MSQPVLGASTLSQKATALTAFGAGGTLLGVHFAALWAQRGGISVWHLLFLPLAPVLADLISGLVHWSADTFGSESTPIVGRRFIRPFRVHHLNGEDILSRRFIDLNGDVALGVLPLLIAAFLAPAPLRLFLVALALCILPTNQIHQWAHRAQAPRLVRFLQRSRLILRRSDHLLHHTQPYRSHYCITTGWANALFDRVIGRCSHPER